MSSSAASEGADSFITVPVICGPTASGKSAVAMWLADRHSVEIISADSRQVYRGFDVGTAKPAAADRRRVPHHGIDVAGPAQRYSAAEWSTLAQDAIAGALQRGRTPLIVGGTGFYIAALVRPLWRQPALDATRRERMQASLGSHPTPELRRWCEALDPARAHLGRVQLLRAIEVALLTGQRLSELHLERARPGAVRASYLLVDPGDALHARIASRAAGMLDGGWVEETRLLMESVPADAIAWKSAGYEVVRQLVRGEVDRSAALERIIVETRQYAKRQRTWFRHQLEPDRVRRLSPVALGWQEEAERWMTEVKTRMSQPERAS